MCSACSALEQESRETVKLRAIIARMIEVAGHSAAVSPFENFLEVTEI
jgi:hypothetical protein